MAETWMTDVDIWGHKITIKMLDKKLSSPPVYYTNDDCPCSESICNWRDVDL